MTITRRGFLQAILAAGVAPAVIDSGVLMPVRKIVTSPPLIIFAPRPLERYGCILGREIGPHWPTHLMALERAMMFGVGGIVIGQRNEFTVRLATDEEIAKITRPAKRSRAR